MKKIVRQQNYLKELIESQENQLISKQALRCLLRSMLEPLLDNPEEGVVLHRINNKSGLMGLLKRLEYSDITAYDYSDEGGNLTEKVWANTEFLCVLTHRFVSIVIWDNKTNNSNAVRFYSLYNSKLQNEALDIIGRNSKVDIKDYQEKFKPDRRDNILLNLSIRSLIQNLDEASKDALLGFAEIQSEKQDEKENQNIRIAVHEVRNQISICDLYTEIIKKQCLKSGIKNESVLNSIGCLSRAIKMANNSLLTLKATEKNVIKPLKLKELISNITNLAKVYFEDKNIEYVVENDADVKIPADENKLSAAILNIIKNAVEAFISDEIMQKEISCPKNGKYIKLQTEEDDNFILIKISNNAGKIKEPEKIFKEGYTTKNTGSGLGLIICKKTIEEMYGQLYLEHNGDDFSEFVIRLAKI